MPDNGIRPVLALAVYEPECSVAVPAAGLRTVLVREPETGGGTPPEPADEEACAT